LQRLGMVRKGCEAAVYTVFPIVWWLLSGSRRYAAQVTQGQRQQPFALLGRRERRQQGKRQGRGAAAQNDRQRSVVELHGVVARLVGRREQRHEIASQRGKHRWLP
jgi:hypothetical protein